jgi:hypothetical protein
VLYGKFIQTAILFVYCCGINGCCARAVWLAHGSRGSVQMVSMDLTVVWGITGDSIISPFFLVWSRAAYLFYQA